LKTTGPEEGLWIYADADSWMITANFFSSWALVWLVETKYGDKLCWFWYGWKVISACESHHPSSCHV